MGGTTRSRSTSDESVVAWSCPSVVAQAVAVVVSPSIVSAGDGSCGFCRPRTTLATVEVLSVPAAMPCLLALKVRLLLMIAPSLTSGLLFGASTPSTSLARTFPAWRVHPIQLGAVRPERSSPAVALTFVPYANDVKAKSWAVRPPARPGLPPPSRGWP